MKKQVKIIEDLGKGVFLEELKKNKKENHDEHKDEEKDGDSKSADQD
jgi:hypothetical protein